MLILISSYGNKLESLIPKRFVHANYFILYNTETLSFETYENIEEGHKHIEL